MPASRYVLAVDLGTSRLKAGVVDESLRLVSSGRYGYETVSLESGMAEQRPADWLDALRRAVADALEGAQGVEVASVVLTAQMPTLVALSHEDVPLGRAVTWQDSRADTLVAERLDPQQRRRVRTIAGTPIDGRYLIPMHLRRTDDPHYQPATILSAKDYLYFVLTGRRVTDPSTASGFGNYSLDGRNWSDELNVLWGIDDELLPEVVDSAFAAPLSRAGAALLEGVVEGTPVLVGGADSVCAHHFISSAFGGAVSVIDGSSTVIIATLVDGVEAPADVLVTPLLDARHVGIELDLLATGSSLGWLAQLFDTTTLALEELALAHPSAGSSDVKFFPYLAGGEQGALWLSDITGSIQGLTRSTTRADIAVAVFEGIAFETLRCLALLGPIAASATLVSASTPGARHFGASLLSALGEFDVHVLSYESPSLVGAALLAHEVLYARVVVARPERGEIPPLTDHYRAALPAKAARYFAASPGVASEA
jgi:xylulokinase